MQLGLTPEQIAKRSRSIGGSDANTLLSGDNDRILRLWREKRCEVEPADLSGVLPVQMGSFTEPFNAYWFEKQTGMKPLQCGREVASSRDPWRTCTLDGLIHPDNDVMKAEDAIWEAKHVSAFAKPDEIVARYYPQLTHNMDVCGLDRAYLSVFFGTLKWEMFEVELDAEYAADLREIEAEFWSDVQSGTTPSVIWTPAAPTLTIDEMRDVSMEGNNLWADLAADFLEYKLPAKRFEDAKSGLKELVENDVRVASGHGVKVTRAKNGSIRIGAE